MVNLTNILSRLYNNLFRSITSNNLIYNTCWEDPRIDRKLLKINHKGHIVMLTSAGCNALDYLLDDPRQIDCVDLNASQNALLEIKQALFKNGSYRLLWEMFGEGKKRGAEYLYQHKIRPLLSLSLRIPNPASPDPPDGKFSRPMGELQVSYSSGFPILDAMKNIEQQIKEIKKELADNPEDFTLLNELGVGYHVLGEYEKAVQSYQQALKEDPTNHQIHYNLANTFFELEEIEKAVNHYLDALDHKPDYVPSLNNLADIYELAGEQERARELFEYITKIKPSDPMGFFNLGNHHLRNNNTVEAGRCYNKTLELDSEFHEAYNNIGLILKHVGKYEEAIEYYEKCLEIEPNYQPAKEDLEEIRKEGN